MGELDKLEEAGILREKLDGTHMRIYSPEKTLADCFKYRNKIGIDVYVEALNLYRRRGRMKLDLIERYAKLCRVERIMRPYLEAVLTQIEPDGQPSILQFSSPP